MGKSPIPKTDYVLYFIRWVAGGLPGVSIVSIYPCVIPVEAYTILGGGCRADDFKTDSPSIRDLKNHALKRTRTSTLFSTRF